MPIFGSKLIYIVECQCAPVEMLGYTNVRDVLYHTALCPATSYPLTATARRYSTESRFT